jgi:hypothetical protein
MVFARRITSPESTIPISCSTHFSLLTAIPGTIGMACFFAAHDFREESSCKLLLHLDHRGKKVYTMYCIAYSAGNDIKYLGKNSHLYYWLCLHCMEYHS